MVGAASDAARCARLPAGDPAQPAEAGSAGGRWAAAVAVVAAAFTGAALVPFLAVPARSRLPWLPTSPARAAAVLAGLCPALTAPGRRFVDLGSGDGTAVLAAARLGMAARGVELNRTLVAASRVAAAAARASGQLPVAARFRRGDLFAEPLHDADVVFVYGVRSLMPRLGARIAATARPDAVVLSRRFPLEPAAVWAPALRGVLGGDVLVYRRAGADPLRAGAGGAGRESAALG